ncbi:MAG: hypothetical protein ACO3SP_01885 [Ilumatobacteraceae bacterium]
MTQSGSGRWDVAAIRAGGSVALVFAVPLSIVARSVSGSGVAVLLSLGAALGFLLGASVAAWHQDRGTPLSHGLVTASGTYLLAQAVFVVVKVLRSGDVNWSGVLFNLAITMTMGVFGGFLGSSLQRRGVHPQGRRPQGRDSQ